MKGSERVGETGWSLLYLVSGQELAQLLGWQEVSDVMFPPGLLRQAVLPGCAGGRHTLHLLQSGLVFPRT